MNHQNQIPLRAIPLVFFDLETTGLRPDRRGRISEMAVADQDGVRFEWSSEQNPPADPVVARQIPRLVEHLQDEIVVGHNLPFDFRFLTYEAERLGVGGLDVQFADTLGLAHELLPGRDGYELGALLAAFDLAPVEELHTAVGDVLATRTLFWRLVNHGDLDTLADIGVKRLRWNAGRG